jgi:thiol-disulfide isomerase/thioredoxin
MFKFLLSIKFLILGLSVAAQSLYKEGDVMQNFSAPNILNHSIASADLGKLKSDITILDFFGTWCVPCIKALPELEKLQQKFPGKLQVLLISIEDKARLDKFLKARPPFAFPIIMDKDAPITSLFNPPSYPYTVVMNAQNKIIAITEAASITENQINLWLKGEVFLIRAGL